ncbi:MAG: ribonuclease HI [Desulfobacterales bacterium]|nr:ribonuclease HI [Desulfobacterales bacterium]MCP4159342.1 ribonuclease HI [Deltaproteobacteria bacterium]
MGKKKFYAVKSGYNPGVYTSWESAKKEVDGFKGALYKSFSKKEEAILWIDGLNDNETTNNKQNIVIYTDGGCINNPGPGGYGAVLIYGDKEKKIKGGFSHTTNNRMELMAVIEALKTLKKKDIPVSLYSDSRYVVNGISKGWAKKWRKNGWIKSDKKRAQNVDLWEILLNLVKDLNIEFIWVKGHAGNKYNEICDTLANGMARKSGLPVDKGFNP